MKAHGTNVNVLLLLLVIVLFSIHNIVKMMVAITLINGIFIPYLLAPHNGPRIYIIIVNENDSEDDDEYYELEEGELLSPPSDWEC